MVAQAELLRSSNGSQLSENFGRVVSGASNVSAEFRHYVVGTNHLFLRIAESHEVQEVLAKVGVKADMEEFRAFIKHAEGPGLWNVKAEEIPLTHRAKTVLHMAMEEANRDNREADNLDLLIAMCSEGSGMAASVLGIYGFGIDVSEEHDTRMQNLQRLRDAVREVRANPSAQQK